MQQICFTGFYIYTCTVLLTLVYSLLFATFNEIPLYFKNEFSSGNSEYLTEGAKR